MEWRSRHWKLLGACSKCGIPWEEHGFDLDLDHMNEPVLNAIVRTTAREQAGHYSAPLPSPANRKLIREQAGRTQQQIADSLDVSRDAVAKWEKTAGWDGDRELPGREPAGEVRAEYSRLLLLLVEDPELAP